MKNPLKDHRKFKDRIEEYKDKFFLGEINEEEIPRDIRKYVMTSGIMKV